MFQPDGVALNDETKVMDLQAGHLTLLQRYLRFKYKEKIAEKKLAFAISMIAANAEAHDFKTEELKKLGISLM